MEHVRAEHKDCRREYCGYCEGGLFTCSVCGASEGQLPKECPGVLMTEKQCAEVMAGHIDFRDGAWVSLHTNPNGTPMFAASGTMLDEKGNRSIFDDVDE